MNADLALIFIPTLRSSDHNVQVHILATVTAVHMSRGTWVVDIALVGDQSVLVHKQSPGCIALGKSIDGSLKYQVVLNLSYHGYSLKRCRKSNEINEVTLGNQGISN